MDGPQPIRYFRKELLSLAVTAEIFDDLSALADTTRSRMLLLLERHELTVSELCAVLQLPQSTVSRHLKALADAGWVASRAEGTSRLYRLARRRPSTPPPRRLWLLVREQVGATPGRRAGSAAAAGRAGASAARSRRSSSRRRPASGIACAKSCSALAFTCAALPALLDDAGSSATSACGTGQVTRRSRRSSAASSRSTARRRCCRRRGGGCSGVSQRRVPAGRARGAADRRCASSMRRR